MRSFDLLGTCRALASSPTINYVTLQTKSTLNNTKRMASILNRSGFSVKIPKEAYEPRTVEGVPLTPIVSWVDSTHICKTSWYRDFVFNRFLKLVVRGGFIEDQFGQAQIAHIRECGFGVHEFWGTWLLDDKQERCVGHVHGRRAVTKEQKEAMIEVTKNSRGGTEARWAAAIAVSVKNTMQEQRDDEEATITRAQKLPPPS
mmetsp:Transcript_4593/g.10816  ORF Transcript_4593/g.10816 Transcript_4593/m.10816 type:complete len:202 (+) Transcript_4593:197-802(+)